jgi:type II secretory pathway pseudopilin PulG
VSKRVRRGIMLFGLAILLAVVVLPWLGLQAAERERAQRTAERIANQELWRRQGMLNYALTIDENSCQYIAEVRGEISSIDLSQANCTFQPTAIEALFRLLERDGQVEQLCDTRGCPCESAVSVHGSYNQERGYPIRVVVDVDLRPAWLKRDLWQHLIANQALPPCMTRTVTVIRVMTIDPR